MTAPGRAKAGDEEAVGPTYRALGSVDCCKLISLHSELSVQAVLLILCVIIDMKNYKRNNMLHVNTGRRTGSQRCRA